MRSDGNKSIRDSNSTKLQKSAERKCEVDKGAMQKEKNVTTTFMHSKFLHLRQFIFIFITFSFRLTRLRHVTLCFFFYFLSVRKNILFCIRRYFLFSFWRFTRHMCNDKNSLRRKKMHKHIVITHSPLYFTHSCVKILIWHR